MYVPHLEDLGVTEYWVVDEDRDPVVKSSCTPFLVSPGYEVIVPTPEMQTRSRYPMPVGDLMECLGQYWEVVAPDGSAIAGFR